MSSGKKRGLDPKLQFGDHLKKLIKSAGYPSVEKFALENGFDRTSIYRIVEKNADLRLSMIVRLLEALEIDPNDLIKPRFHSHRKNS